jgi:hypothetical protein
MEFKELCELIEDAGYTPRSYSGRGMYGRYCLGVVIEHSNPSKVLTELILSLCIFAGTEADQLERVQWVCQNLDDMRSDSMGRDMIVYWPDIKWEELDSED